MVTYGDYLTRSYHLVRPPSRCSASAGAQSTRDLVRSKISRCPAMAASSQPKRNAWALEPRCPSVRWPRLDRGGPWWMQQFFSWPWWTEGKIIRFLRFFFQPLNLDGFAIFIYFGLYREFFSDDFGPDFDLIFSIALHLLPRGHGIETRCFGTRWHPS